MIDFKRLSDSFNTEPYKPYVYTGICYKCLKENKKHVDRGSEGKEENGRLYVRLTCPNNPEHHSTWTGMGKRPLGFRIMKVLRLR